MRAALLSVTITVAILVIGAAAYYLLPQHHNEASSGLIVPLYMDPGNGWAQLAQIKEAHPAMPIVAIVNPNDGPGNAIDSSYVSGIEQLQSANVTVIGYVDTSYGNASAGAVESEINRWHAWYQPNGIFFDRMPNTAGLESYYRNLSNYSYSLGMPFTVGNPGTDTAQSYIGTVNTLCIYEDVGLPQPWILQGWHANYTKSDFCMIAIGTALPTQSFVTNAAQYTGYMYVTNGTLPNPYGALPPYLGGLAAELQRHIP